MRRHISNVRKDLHELMVATILRSESMLQSISEDVGKMRSVAFSDDEAFQCMGLLFGRKVLTISQLPEVKGQWLKPTYETFRERNLWSFYNACSAALQSCPPARIMERHIALHQLLTAAIR